MDLDTQLRTQVELAIGRSVGAAPVLKLKGDASNRSYYRVGTAPESWVLMAARIFRIRSIARPKSMVRASPPAMPNPLPCRASWKARAARMIPLEGTQP